MSDTIARLLAPVLERRAAREMERQASLRRFMPTVRRLLDGEAPSIISALVAIGDERRGAKIGITDRLDRA